MNAQCAFLVPEIVELQFYIIHVQECVLSVSLTVTGDKYQ